jgi:crotonobetainyl-CoA:carnitine CoA-transferase CaiB-like acyl-CoA transferase
MSAGLYATNALMFALYHRDVHGGPGQCIDVALFESLFSMLGPLAAEYAALGRVRLREGSRSKNTGPRGCYRTSDDRWIAVSGSTPKMAERFLRAYGLDGLLSDPRFASNEARVRHATLLDAAIGGAIATRTLDENIAVIRQYKLTAVPVQTVADIQRDPHWQSRGLITRVPGDRGDVPMHTVIPRLSETPGRIDWAGGALGQHTCQVLGDELGLSEGEIARLQADGVI